MGFKLLHFEVVFYAVIDTMVLRIINVSSRRAEAWAIQETKSGLLS